MADDLAEKVWGQLAGGWQNGRDATAARLAFEALLARLTTAETEREQAEAHEKVALAVVAAAEARVEALSEALRDIATDRHAHSREDAFTVVRRMQSAARAALACPPQTERDQERDTAAANIAALRDRCQGFHARAHAAEARVEAAERVVEAAQALVDDWDGYPEQRQSNVELLAAALACPPQQPGEK